MSREIKFRVFDKPKKSMYYYKDLMEFCWQYLAYWLIWIFKIMQYTGLKDKNWKEIYEGDILKFKHPKYDKDYRKFRILYDENCISFLIEYLDEKWQLKSISSIGIHASQRDHWVEVIWNIHENKSLISNIKKWKK